MSVLAVGGLLLILRKYPSDHTVSGDPWDRLLKI